MTEKSAEESGKVTLFSLSDSTGETALSLIRAARVQFPESEISVERHDRIRTRAQLEAVLEQAAERSAIVVTTIVNQDLRIFLMSRAMQLNVQLVDVLFPLLETVSVQLGRPPTNEPGLLRQLDRDYFRRVLAIEYTVRHDDGLQLGDLHEADVVLVGISRTSKTPLSMYLGHKGYKVANIPLVRGAELPRELFKIDQNKIVALTIDMDRLTEIRAARMQSLGAQETGAYADAEQILEEIEWAHTLFRRNRRWPVIDVTEHALEENAVEIERIIVTRNPKARPVT